ncbi:MAG: extracellular solute-binding protein [Chloroflexi bacterium]|nr:extracellular solute-binding protein [Chloroflexota bacterium]
MNESRFPFSVPRFTFHVLLVLLLAACASPTPAPTTVTPVGATAATTPEPLATRPSTSSSQATAQAQRTAPAPTRAATTASDKTLKAVLLLAAIDSPRQELFEQLWTENTRGITGTVRLETADNDAATQRVQVQAALADGARVLVIQPVDPDAAGLFVDAAHKAGVKVIAFDRLINTRDLDAYVSHDLQQIGRLQAQAAVNWLTAQKTKTPWNFILLEGAAGDPLASEITRGYFQVLDPLKAKNQVKLIADRANSDWSAAQGQTATTEELTKAKNNVQAVLANNSALARGALAALDAQKLTGKVFVAGAGADPENYSALCSGAQHLDLTRDDDALARSAVKLALALANDQTPAAAGFPNNTIRLDDRDVFQVAIPVQPLTLDSMQATLVQRGIVSARQLGSCFPPLPTGATAPQTDARGALTVWVQEDASGPVYAYLANLAAAFMAANPGVEIQLVPQEAKTVRETFADASDSVDLLWTTNEELQQFAARDLLRAADFITVTQFVEPALAGGTRDGTLYGVPVSTGNNLVLYYNKKLLKEPPKDTDALIRLGATLTKEASGQYTLAYDTTNPFWLLPWLGGYKGAALASDGRTPTLNTRAMTETLTLLKTFKDKKVALPDADLGIADAIFTDGRAAMIINGDEALNTYQTRFGSDLGVTRLPPVSKQDNPRPYTGGIYFAVPVGTGDSRLEVAKAFIQFVTSKAIQMDMAKKFRRLPALQAALQDTTITNDPILKGMSDQMLLGIAPPDSAILTCLWEAVRPNQIAVLNGTAQPDAAAQAMQASAEACIRKLP